MTTRTGWPPGMLQDDSRELSCWLASKPDAKRLAREKAQEIANRLDLPEPTSLGRLMLDRAIYGVFWLGPDGQRVDPASVYLDAEASRG